MPEQKPPVTLDLCFRKTRVGKAHENREVIVSAVKLRFKHIFHPH